MERLFDLLWKGVFVAGCCTITPGLIGSILSGPHSNTSQSDQTIGLVGSALLFASLVAAALLGWRGRSSASWLTLAYGSWLTMLVLFYLGGLQIAPRSVWGWVTLAVMIPLVWGGLRAALRGRWDAVLFWWLGSFSLIVCHSIWAFTAR